MSSGRESDGEERKRDLKVRGDEEEGMRERSVLTRVFIPQPLVRAPKSQPLQTRPIFRANNAVKPQFRTSRNFQRLRLRKSASEEGPRVQGEARRFRNLFSYATAIPHEFDAKEVG